MPNRNQIIVISVLGIAALMLGCKPNATGIGKVAGVHRELTLEEKKIVGTYEHKGVTGTTQRLVFLDNGIRESYKNGNNQNKDSKWSLVENEIHIEYTNGNVNCWKANPDNSITFIAYTDDGKRTDIPKDIQFTCKKIN